MGSGSEMSSFSYLEKMLFNSLGLEAIPGWELLEITGWKSTYFLNAILGVCRIES